jgi:hypothetical protein
MIDEERASQAGGHAMDFDRDKVDEVVFALLYLTLHEVDEYGGRAWNGLDWQTMDRLHEKGLIGNPRSKAKSVTLDAESVRRCEAAFDRWFGKGEG